MGDRVVFQVFKRLRPTGIDLSPAIYGHWSGGAVPEVCRRLRERMADRPFDVNYTAARCVQELIGAAGGNTGFGISNQLALLTVDDAEDAGVVLIEATDNGLVFECVGGYLTIGNDGLPKDPHAKPARAMPKSRLSK
jgi:hypothetical protein